MMRYKILEEARHKDIYVIYLDVYRLLLIVTIGYVVLSWIFKKLREFRRLKNDKTAAELALLKSKIDPHFFFNTLNNLYSLAIKKSDEAPQVILKLSEIMRYTIYDAESETVPLKDEINYLEQYVEIQKIRYKKSVLISFKKLIENENTKLAPLLFIMLLENAFKHGVESLTDNAYIDILLEEKNKDIRFMITNNFEVKETNTRGIGIKNLKKRLELIYPKRHSLSINSKPNIYMVELKITLK